MSMPTLTLDDNNAAYQVRAYKPGFIQVNETTFTRSLIISANELITDWAPQSISELSAEHLHNISPLSPTILLIGTGETLCFPDLELYGPFIHQGNGDEIMSLEASDAEADPMYDQAVAVVLKTRRPSISLVQRHLRIGYNRAARLIEQMERAGLVSPMQTNGNREVLVPAGKE